jgi:hypothetical protein
MAGKKGKPTCPQPQTNQGMRKCGKGGNTAAKGGGTMHTSTPNPKQS